jgi:NADP-dependent aldehyde dehydrogenase
LVADAILAAARAFGLPDGVFALLFDAGHEVGQALVSHPLIKAVGFTGSRAGGDALMRLAAARPEPITVYAEMGSINPVFMLPAIIGSQTEQIASGLHASFTLGAGQFCTNPGVVLLPAGEAGDALRDELIRKTEETVPGIMLNAGIGRAYEAGLERLKAAGASLIGQGQAGAEAGIATVLETDLATATGNRELLDEVFGASTLLVRYHGTQELAEFARSLEGQLTATLFGEPEELEQQRELLGILEHKVGRLIINEFPTGVEVGPAMVHGGPYPASSDGRSTSVGTRAIERFTRYVAYQNFPRELLPVELRG